MYNSHLICETRFAFDVSAFPHGFPFSPQASARSPRPLGPTRVSVPAPPLAAAEPSFEPPPSRLPGPPPNAPAPRKGKSMYVASDGALYVDDVSADELRAWAEGEDGRQGAPLCVYSGAQLDANYAAYDDALRGIPSIARQAIKRIRTCTSPKGLASSALGRCW